MYTMDIFGEGTEECKETQKRYNARKYEMGRKIELVIGSIDLWELEDW